MHRFNSNHACGLMINFDFVSPLALDIFQAECLFQPGFAKAPQEFKNVQVLWTCLPKRALTKRLVLSPGNAHTPSTQETQNLRPFPLSAQSLDTGRLQKLGQLGTSRNWKPFIPERHLVSPCDDL